MVIRYILSVLSCNSYATMHFTFLTNIYRVLTVCQIYPKTELWEGAKFTFLQPHFLSSSSICSLCEILIFDKYYPTHKACKFSVEKGSYAWSTLVLPILTWWKTVIFCYMNKWMTLSHISFLELSITLWRWSGNNIFLFSYKCKSLSQESIHICLKLCRKSM